MWQKTVGFSLLLLLIMVNGMLFGRPIAEEYRSPRGTRGWRFPLSSQALPPAVKDSVVYTSGGSHSYAVYALKAETGEIIWEHRTNDDGPTSPVVTEDYVAYTTFSCTVDVLDAKTGEIVWSHWLAPTLFSFPTIGSKTLYVSYCKLTDGCPNRIEAYDLATGRSIWETPIDSEVLSAPILADGYLYATTANGCLYRIDAESGKETWHYDGALLAAPTISGKNLFLTQSGHITEELEFGSTETLTLSPVQIVNWLNTESGQTTFEITPAENHREIRQGVARGGRFLFNFAGARPLALSDKVISPTPSGLLAIDIDSGQIKWCTELETRQFTRYNEQAVSPAVYAGGKIFAGTRDGRLLCISPKDGTILWQENVGTPILHEPIVSKGRIYLAGQNSLICLNTRDEKIDGWPMWGGSPSHNR